MCALSTIRTTGCSTCHVMARNWFDN